MRISRSKLAILLVLLIPLYVSYGVNPKTFAADDRDVLVQLPPPEVDWVRFYAERYNIDTNLSQHIVNAADKTGVPRMIAFALVSTESSFNQWAVSERGAIGLTQVMPGTGAIFGVSKSDLFDIDINLETGFSYLMYLHDYYDGNMRRALTAYNYGPTRLDSLISVGVVVKESKTLGRYYRKILGD